jgi:hypothetical protein
MKVADIKAEWSMLDLLHSYGLDEWGIGFYEDKWVKIHCPFHADENPSAVVNPMDDRFRCFVCDIHGDIFDVVEQVEGMSFKEAKDWITEHFLSE